MVKKFFAVMSVVIPLAVAGYFCRMAVQPGAEPVVVVGAILIAIWPLTLAGLAIRASLRSERGRRHPSNEK